MSSEPNCAATSSMPSLTATSPVTSIATPRALPPASLISSAASRSVGIVEYLVKLLPSVSLQCFNLRRGKHGVVLPDLVDEKFLRIAIARTAIQDALRGPAVASSAARAVR